MKQNHVKSRMKSENPEQEKYREYTPEQMQQQFWKFTLLLDQLPNQSACQLPERCHHW